MRIGKYYRETKETEVKIEIDLDGTGKSNLQTPLKFFNHMLASFSTHSMIDIKVEAKGDLKHHIVEDVALGLGTAFRGALESDGSITRFGYALVPMDDSLSSCALDLGNRPYSAVDLKTKSSIVEDAAIEDLTHFFESLATSMRANIHIKVEYGKNDHHKIEASFKALALCLRSAFSIDPKRKGIPSSKGVL